MNISKSRARAACVHEAAKRGISYRAFINEVGIGKNALRSSCGIRESTLATICNATGASADWILGLGGHAPWEESVSE